MPIATPRSELAVLVLAAAAAASAQTPAPADPLRAAFVAFDRGRYLQGVDALADLAMDARGAVRDQQAYQLWMQFSPFVTNELAIRW